MLALVKKPHIEISIHGDYTDELLSWIRKKYELIILSIEDNKSDSIPVEETDFWQEMESNRIGNLLAGARHKSGLTQSELAKRVGICQNMISNYERGTRGLTSEMIEKLSSVLKINPEYLRK